MISLMRIRIDMNCNDHGDSKQEGVRRLLVDTFLKKCLPTCIVLQASKQLVTLGQSFLGILSTAGSGRTSAMQVSLHCPCLSP